MEFYIGGYAQGKLEYLLQKYPQQELEIWDGAEVMKDKAHTEKKIVWNHFHLWVRTMLEEGQNPEQALWEFLSEYPDCVIISDEIGNGIVPIEQQEREYRERLGRIQTALAKKAERVERILCGMGQRLK